MTPADLQIARQRAMAVVADVHAPQQQRQAAMRAAATAAQLLALRKRPPTSKTAVEIERLHALAVDCFAAFEACQVLSA